MSKELNDLESSFDEWFTVIKRVLAKPLPKQPLSKNTDKVGGYTLAQLEQMIRDILTAHMGVPDEHKLTLQQIGALSKSEILEILSTYQNAHNVPLSDIPNLASKTSVNWATRVITIQAGTVVIHLGKKFTLPALSATLAALNDQTVSLRFAGAYDNKTISLVHSETSAATADVNHIPVLKVNLTAKTILARRVTRIGRHELSLEPNGTSIPVTNGLDGVKNHLVRKWYED